MIFMICIILIHQKKMKIKAKKIYGSRGEKLLWF